MCSEEALGGRSGGVTNTVSVDNEMQRALGRLEDVFKSLANSVSRVSRFNDRMIGVEAPRQETEQKAKAAEPSNAMQAMAIQTDFIQTAAVDLERQIERMDSIG